MNYKPIALMAALLFSIATAASPVITSVTPSSGPDGGGTIVTIKGSGFETCLICSPPTGPFIYFGGTYAPNPTLIDATTIEVATPPHLSGPVNIQLFQGNDQAFLADAFTFEETGEAGFESILLPIFSPVVHGQYGSEFHTTVRAASRVDLGVATIYGVDGSCSLADPPQFPTNPVQVAARANFILSADCSLWPARLLYVPRGEADRLTFTSHVTDVSRIATGFGTEIPVVRSADIQNKRVVLTGVPVDGRFRNTLRIYSTQQREFPVTVTINGLSENVILHPGQDRFEPAYAQFTNFPTQLPEGSDGTFTVTIDPPSYPGPNDSLQGPGIWAFITVTNNDTQQITTISPN